ncbi:MAG TPA: Dabb family protein [Gemmatimonadales bacterium]|nr:Dabb family protein [Gemmatimonadales bacterium]
MIHHIVLFRFKPGTTEQAIGAMKAALLSMPPQIPDIRWIDFGPNQAPGPTEYTHALVIGFDDMAAVRRYGEDPHHKAVIAEFIAPIREARLAVDVEIGWRMADG